MKIKRLKQIQAPHLSMKFKRILMRFKAQRMIQVSYHPTQVGMRAETIQKMKKSNRRQLPFSPKFRGRLKNLVRKNRRKKIERQSTDQLI